jgi:hypothetical protein
MGILLYTVLYCTSIWSVQFPVAFFTIKKDYEESAQHIRYLPDERLDFCVE